MKTADEITSLVKETFGGKPGKFRSCAFFDDRLDCIRVIARDCSVLETRVNQFITILEDNYSESGGKQYVGFTVKGARHFCKQHNFDLSAPIEMSALLDAILASFPEVAIQLFVNAIARPLVKEEKIKSVDVSGAMPQPA
ncbi:MAG TPA: hypothetical protein VGK22_15045 [Candidatus Angelobacter sp.]|jgi:hypothetical protein